MLFSSESFIKTYGDDFGRPIVMAPFPIGSIIELKENPSCVLRITQYRLGIGEHLNGKLYVGLAVNIYDDEKVDFEIPIEEIALNWKETDLTNLNNLFPWRFNPECKTFEELATKLKLTKKL